MKNNRNLYILLLSIGAILSSCLNNKSKMDTSIKDSLAVSVADKTQFDTCLFIERLRYVNYNKGITKNFIDSVALISNWSKTSPGFYGTTAGIFYPDSVFESDVLVWKTYFSCNDSIR